MSSTCRRAPFKRHGAHRLGRACDRNRRDRACSSRRRKTRRVREHGRAVALRHQRSRENRCRGCARRSISRCGPRPTSGSRQHGLRANSRVELPPGRYQVRVGVRESGAGEMGTVFYDLDVPDFGREPLDDERVAADRPIRAARHARCRPTTGRASCFRARRPAAAAFTTSDDAGAVCRNLRRRAGEIAPRIDVTTRLIAESGSEVSVARDELSGGAAAGRDKSATYTLSRSIPLRDVAPGAICCGSRPSGEATPTGSPCARRRSRWSRTRISGS